MFSCSVIYLVVLLFDVVVVVVVLVWFFELGDLSFSACSVPRHFLRPAVEGREGKVGSSVTSLHIALFMRKCISCTRGVGLLLPTPAFCLSTRKGLWCLCFVVLLLAIFI